MLRAGEPSILTQTSFQIGGEPSERGDFCQDHFPNRPTYFYLLNSNLDILLKD